MEAQQNEAQQNAWHIRKEEILRQMTPSELMTLEGSTERIRRERGETVFLDEGDNAKVFIVDEGYVRICHLTEDGRRFILGVLGPGEFFGAVTPNLHSEEPEDVLEVIRDAKLLAIDARAFHSVLKNHPEMMMRLAQLIELKKRHFQKRITSILFKDLAARTAELLMELTSKSGEPCKLTGAPAQDINLTHQEIADMLGAARPVISKTLSRMAKKGLIRKHGQVICLLDKPGLIALFEQGASFLEG